MSSAKRTASQGRPISIEAFPGNTTDSRTFGSQVRKAADRFGGKGLTLVGDRGMIKGPQIEQIQAEDSLELHYIAAITKPRVETLLKQDLIQMDLFDETIAEVVDEEAGMRYVLRRKSSPNTTRTASRLPAGTSTRAPSPPQSLPPAIKRCRRNTLLLAKPNHRTPGPPEPRHPPPSNRRLGRIRNPSHDSLQSVNQKTKRTTPLSLPGASMMAMMGAYPSLTHFDVALAMTAWQDTRKIARRLTVTAMQAWCVFPRFRMLTQHHNLRFGL